MTLVLAVVMVLSMSAMVYAEGEGETPAATAGDVSITIKDNETAGGTVSTEYHYYQLLHASINGDAVSYYLINGTDDALRTLLDAVKVDGADLFTFTKSADGTRWTATINKKADDSEYTDADGAKIAAALNTDAIKAAALSNNTFSQDNSGSVFANVPEKGYYLVTSTLGTNLVLQTLGKVEINTKNEYFTDVKTASKTNMNVGDTVTYTITVHVPETAVPGKKITVHDTLDSHLQINASSIAAKLGSDNVALTDGTKKAATETFAKEFTITEDMLNQDVVITYTAELLSTAANDEGYVNTTFANDDSYETVPSEVKVWTFDFNLDKTFVGAASGKEDDFSATFELRKDSATGTAISLKEVSTTTGEGDDAVTTKTGYVKADSDDTGTTTSITITGGAALNINGLEAGTYYLVETATADGYNLLKDPIKVTITDTTSGTQPEVTVSHTVKYQIGSGDEVTNKTVAVENNAGTELPSTGGIGTTIFYILGSVLVIGGGIMLISRKRLQK